MNFTWDTTSPLLALLTLPFLIMGHRLNATQGPPRRPHGPITLLRGKKTGHIGSGSAKVFSSIQAECSVEIQAKTGGWEILTRCASGLGTAAGHSPRAPEACYGLLLSPSFQVTSHWKISYLT